MTTFSVSLSSITVDTHVEESRILIASERSERAYLVVSRARFFYIYIYLDLYGHGST